MKIYSLFLFSLLWITDLKAEIPFPKVVLTVNDLVDEFRAPLRLKIADLSKNYIIDYNGPQLVFTSHEKTTCLRREWPSRTSLAKIEYFYQVKNNILTEVAHYYGCNNLLSLKEIVITEGSALKPLLFKDFIKGKRDFKLKAGQTSSTYQLLNDKGKELFFLQQDRTLRGITANYSMLGGKFMNMTYEFLSEVSNLVITYYPISVEYKTPWRSWNINTDFTPYTGKVFSYKSPKGRVEYINSRNLRISQNNYISNFNFNAIKRNFSKMNEIVKFHNNWFPETKAARAVGAGQKFLTELRLNLTRLLNNTELNLVRLFIQELIKAVDSGLIIDQRPNS